MTRIFHDWEFLEDGKTIEPISCGFVSSTGEEYYGVVKPDDELLSRLHDHQWLKDNVLPHIMGVPAKFLKTKEQIAHEVTEFILSFPKPELWAWYGAYDHVVLAQTLGGPMINLPKGVPMFTNDIKTLELMAKVNSRGKLAHSRMDEDVPKQDPSTVHHALHDAQHDKALYDHYMNWI